VATTAAQLTMHATVLCARDIEGLYLWDPPSTSLSAARCASCLSANRAVTKVACRLLPRRPRSLTGRL